ncbi:Rieske (2Fe-2S) protein [Zhihengliuella flava]|uniref:Cytochrome bc1 complex Rieske iron-sulfur subunit n=1 Tax=Zhihengliuella flava TaxID=1285193 RepID=A0A931GJU1_9MICC|nr:Rieske (2Fe-2S) protein [Zhihengliuella flava]MBG6085701.1 Rieske Fe-S protein [Zhihengliuella flava]
MTAPLKRRRVLAAAPAVGAGAALAACSSSPSATQSPSTAAPSPSGDGVVVASTTELARGTKLSVEVEGRNYLLFRPSEADVLAYRALCTHGGCQVMIGNDEVFQCPCHNSEFSHEAGAPVAGPADQPLEKFAAAIDGEDVLLYV